MITFLSANGNSENYIYIFGELVADTRNYNNIL